jgi:plastocyanin
MNTRARHVVAAAIALGAMSNIARANNDGTITGTVTARPAKYTRDSVVYLESAPAARAPRTFEMDQRAMEFAPHILTIKAGDTVRFLNHDPLDHNVYSPDCHYDLGTWGNGGQRTHTFAKPGTCTQLCKLHPEMVAYIFVGQNQYAAAVDKDGHYTITGVPPGTYQLRVWNAQLHAESQKVEITSGGVAHVDLAVHR